MALFKELLKGRMFGHPIHAMLVHFPAALFPVSFVLDAAGFITGKISFAQSAFFTLAMGLVGGVGAGIFGAIDYFRLPSEHPAWGKASIHALLNFTWLVIFGVLFGLKSGEYPQIQIISLPELIASGLAVSGLLFSSKLGGDLVFRYKLGTIEEKKS